MFNSTAANGAVLMATLGVTSPNGNFAFLEGMMRGYEVVNTSLMSITTAAADAARATADESATGSRSSTPLPATPVPPKPWLISSGTEDYFLGTFYFDKGQYFMPLAGVTALCPEPNDGAHRISVGCM